MVAGKDDEIVKASERVARSDRGEIGVGEKVKVTGYDGMRLKVSRVREGGVS